MVFSYPDLVRKHPWFNTFFEMELLDDAHSRRLAMKGDSHQNVFKAGAEVLCEIGVRAWIEPHPGRKNYVLFLDIDLDDPKWLLHKIKYS